MLLLRSRPATPTPAAHPHPTPQAQAVTLDPIVGRSLLALAAGLVLILAGALLDPPLAVLNRLVKD